MSESRKILLKRKRPISVINNTTLRDSVEEWASYWRANIHRFNTEYLGLRYQAEFQPILIYYMDRQPNFMLACSRGLAKTTLVSIYSVDRCILYPETTIVVAAPAKGQSADFIGKIKMLAKSSPNLIKELENGMDSIKISQNGCSVTFANGSKIITKTFAETARGARCNILIIDEFAMIKDKNILTGTFVPMLTSGRKPLYRDLSMKERAAIQEPTRQLYLSSIRTEVEWSWEYLNTYLNNIISGDTRYGLLCLPYHLGVKGGYIQKDNVEQVFKENPEMFALLKAEYEAIPIRGDTGSFFKFTDMEKVRDHCQTFVAKSDEEYIEYKDKPEKWKFYVEKLPGEIRVLSMDIALIESPKNDNTSFWLTRLIPNGDRYYKVISYAESLHGLNSVIQAKRLKQLFYEFECDLVGIDAAGAGIGTVDICMGEIYDEIRGVTYPAWTTVNPEDLKSTNRVLTPNAVPVMYVIKTSSYDKHCIFVNARDMITSQEIHFPISDYEAIDEFNKKYNYYKIDNPDLKRRMLDPYVQTNMLIFEAINLETVVSNGYYNLKEKPSRRKDRVMSLCYNLDIVKQKEEEYIALQNQRTNSFLDYVMFT